MSAPTDRKTFNLLAQVLGVLIGLAVLLFLMAKLIPARPATFQVSGDPAERQLVEERIRPIGQVAIAGEDNTGLRGPGAVIPTVDAPAPVQPVEDTSPAAAVPEAAPAVAQRAQNGEAVYKAACTACHGAGIAGAPKTGDAPAWEARLEQGMATMVKHAIEGFQGETGFMPARGGHMNLSDEQVREAVQYMVDQLGR